MVNSTIIDDLDFLIKEISSITILGEFANEHHLLELGTKDSRFFVRLDGAILYNGPDAERAIALFYSKIATIYADEQKGVDPGFATLREILLSRNQHIQEMLTRLGHSGRSKSLQLLSFSAPPDETQIYKEILTGLRLLESVHYRRSEKEGIECHTCFAYSEGGYCTLLKVPVLAEYVCHLYTPAHEAAEREEFAEVTNQPYEIGELTKGQLSVEDAKRSYEQQSNPPETSAIVAPFPKPNNVTHGSTMADDKDYMVKATDIGLSAKALITYHDDRILLLKDAYSSWWDLPGGHLKNNETIEDGLRREIYEETGLLAFNIEQLFVRQLKLGHPPTPRPIVFFSANAHGKIKYPLNIRMLFGFPILILPNIIWVCISQLFWSLLIGRVPSPFIRMVWVATRWK